MPTQAKSKKKPGILQVSPPVLAPPASPLIDPDALLATSIARHGDDPDFVTALARGLAVLLAL